MQFLGLKPVAIVEPCHMEECKLMFTEPLIFPPTFTQAKSSLMNDLAKCQGPALHGTKLRSCCQLAWKCTVACRSPHRSTSNKHLIDMNATLKTNKYDSETLSAPACAWFGAVVTPFSPGSRTSHGEMPIAFAASSQAAFISSFHGILRCLHSFPTRFDMVGTEIQHRVFSP